MVLSCIFYEKRNVENKIYATPPKSLIENKKADHF
jgi:hypothetical protein